MGIVDVVVRLLFVLQMLPLAQINETFFCGQDDTSFHCSVTLLLHHLKHFNTYLRRTHVTLCG